MKIFLAGATGAVGLPLIRHLRQKGHEIWALSRSPERVAELEMMGVHPIIGDALKQPDVQHAIEKARPQAVIDMLTALPKVYTPQAMKEASGLNDRLRKEGGAYLQQAAERFGTSRYILQSSAFWYEPGEGLADEKTPFAFNASSGISAGCKVYAELESRVLSSRHLEGTALRFGFFYGQGTWYSKEGDMGRQVLERRVPIVAGGGGIWSFVHIDDVAKAIGAALTSPPGIYNITDDHPLRQSQWLPAFARYLGAPPPLTRSAEEELSINGPDSLYYATRLRGASNQKAKEILAFHPRPLEWLEG